MFLRSLILVLILTTTSFAQTAELASVRVYKYGGRNNKKLNNDLLPDSKGSGWLVTTHQVITAYHVVHNNRGGDKAVLVRFTDGFKTWGMVEAYSKKHDIALIWINPHKTIRPIPIMEMPEAGNSVIIHGFGHDYEYRAHKGILVNRLKGTKYDFKAQKGRVDADPEGHWQGVWVVAIPGDSGGPVTFNGKVIGSVLSTTSAYSVFCRIDTIQETFKNKFRYSILRIK